MWDRIAATAALACSLPMVYEIPLLLVPWLLFTLIWVMRDHRHTGKWGEVQVSVLTITEKQEIATMVAKSIRAEITTTTTTTAAEVSK